MELPIRLLSTQTLAPETFLVRQLGGEGMSPELLHLNTLVIRGAEPVIVDTGAPLNGDAWLERTFELVDPADVRWVFLSHDDCDHTGRLHEVLDACPSATLVTNWFSVERMATERLLPLDRLRMLNPGESFVAGDRTLTAVVPPTFDSPPPAACSTRARACTGPLTRSPPPCPTRWTTWPSWTATTTATPSCTSSGS